MSDKTFTCELHGYTGPALSQYEAERRGMKSEEMGCPDCTADLLARRDPETMTGDERAAEVMEWLAERPLTTSLDLLFRRLEALVGRGIWTHEYVEAGLLAEEARTHEHPKNLQSHVMGLARDIVGDKPVIGVEL